MKKITDYYEDKLREYGDDARSVGWRDSATQAKRFAAIADVSPLDGKSVLDLGCGLAHFYRFLKERGWSGDYTGWDLSSEMIARCREKFPDAQFAQTNILEIAGEKKFDIVCGSGLFCVPLDDDSFYYKIIKRMYEMCREAVAFNCISSYVDFREDHLRYTDPREMFDFCKTNLSRYVALRHDYMPFEFTVYAYRKED